LQLGSIIVVSDQVFNLCVFGQRPTIPRFVGSRGCDEERHSTLVGSEVMSPFNPLGMSSIESASPFPEIAADMRPQVRAAEMEVIEVK
jgi:hypothetical protein